MDNKIEDNQENKINKSTISDILSENLHINNTYANSNKTYQKKSKIHQQLGSKLNALEASESEFSNNKYEEDEFDEEETSTCNFDIGKNIYRYNIILVGDCAVGKTSIINSFIDNKFMSNLKNTINIEFRVKSINFDNNTVIDLKIWDTCGQEKFRAITKNYYQQADGVFIVFDLSELKTLNAVKYFIKDIKEICGNKVMMIIGNKCDLSKEEKQVKEKDIIKILKKYNDENSDIIYLEVSAKRMINIKEMFTQMSKLIFLNKKSILESEDGEDAGSHFKIGKDVDSVYSKSTNNSIKIKNKDSIFEEEGPREKCC